MTSRTLVTRRTILRTAIAASATFSAPFVRSVCATTTLSFGVANVMFGRMGAQVQVQNQTNDRLTTWTNALTKRYVVSYTDWRKPIAPQLEGNGRTSLQDILLLPLTAVRSISE
jgi:p-aminobenzoyl-glutamate transporter AbgT